MLYKCETAMEKLQCTKLIAEISVQGKDSVFRSKSSNIDSGDRCAKL